MKKITSLLISLLLVSLLTCSQASATQGGFSGKVTETMDAGGYTYVLVDTGTNKLWTAATKFGVKKGDSVAITDSQPMTNFQSKTLNRTFPVIYFASSVEVNGAKPSATLLPANHPPLDGGAPGQLPAGHPPTASGTPPPKVDFTGLKPAKDGKTVAQIYATSAQLERKSVRVRGKVVKYNANILGKNWLHIQDGTGSAGSNDILITTADQAKRGDTVLVQGKVARNKDFGSGYKYDLLIEEARVVVE